MIGAGSCLDLVDVCVKSMNRACEDLYYSFEKPISGPEFYVKELMRGYLALKDKVSKNSQWLDEILRRGTLTALSTRRWLNLYSL